MEIHTTEVEEEERQWIGMKDLMKGNQSEGLGQVLLKDILEGEMAEDTYPKAH